MKIFALISFITFIGLASMSGAQDNASNFQPASGRILSPPSEREVKIEPERQVRIVPIRRQGRRIIYRDRPVYNQVNNYYNCPDPQFYSRPRYATRPRRVRGED